MEMQFTKDFIVDESVCDKDGYVLLEQLILELVRAAMFRNRSEGAGAPAIRAAFGAVWMFRRMKLEQFRPVRVGDRLEGYGSGRTKQKTTYVMRGEYFRDGELVARLEFLVMPVAVDSRKKLSLDEVETLYTTKPANYVQNFERLEITEGVEYDLEKTITPDDCDANGHFASQNYARLVGALTGFYDRPGRSFKLMQVDFVKECMPGGTIKIAKMEKNGGYKIQGIHTNKKPCFNAYCIYND